MEYRPLGSTGVRLSAFSLGTTMLGSWGNSDRDACAAIVNRALDAGINCIDTADVYSEGEAEEIVGAALGSRRDEVFLATKVHSAMGPRPNEGGNSRLWILRAVEDSLRRLRTDRIDLYQVHRPEPGTAIDETLDALTDLVHQGKVRYIGSSTFQAWQVVEAQQASGQRGLARFVSEQPPYSIFVRAIERDVLEVARRYGIGILVWSPLAGGWLTGKYRRGEAPPRNSRAARHEEYRSRGGRMDERYNLASPANRQKFDVVEALSSVASGAGITVRQMALAFTLAPTAVTSTIIGPRTMEHLEDLIASADVRLTDDVLAEIDRIMPPGTVVNDADLGWDPPWLASRGEADSP